MEILLPGVRVLTKPGPHRIIESKNSLGWTFKGQLVQLPCNEQGHLQLDQVTSNWDRWAKISPFERGALFSP